MSAPITNASGDEGFSIPKSQWEPFRIVIGNQASIMRSIALLLESGTVGCHTAASELRKIAEINEKIIQG